MDAEEPTRAEYIKAGVFFLLIFLGVGYIFPRFMGALLMLFSVLVFVLAVVGLAWPSVMKLPNRLASVWVFAVSVGLFMGGGMLMAPQNGESTASDETPSPIQAVPKPVPTVPSDDLVKQLRRAEGRTACNAELEAAIRVLYTQGLMYRWTSIHLDIRFPGRRETGNPDVVT